jgi:hypothetical protein
MDVIVSATRILVRSCEEEAEVMTRNRTIIRGVKSARKLGTALASVDADSCIAERMRREEAERVSTIYIQLVDSIDYYVRTRNKFDSSNPTAYRCGFSSILQDSDVIAAHRTLCSIPGCNTMALLTLVRNMSKDFKMHEDNYSNNIFVSVIKLTPGRKDRMFGYYKCSSCRRKWASSWSWMDKFQQCNKCNSKCYAYRRDQLRGERTDDYKPHDQARCEKCREVGDCTRFR